MSIPQQREGLWRDLAPQVLARLLRTYGPDQFDACEDAVQEALLAAHQQWEENPPQDPLGWLITTSRWRYVDWVRSDRSRRDRETKVDRLTEPLLGQGTSSGDDSLLVLQLCCHPELPRAAQIALTLRAVCGLTTAQISHVYQLPEATVAQRITRAKRRLDELGRVFPATTDPSALTPTVLNVIYVMFTEAHHTMSGSPARDADLADEALHLGRQLRSGAPGDTEVAGLLALMLFTEARQPARITAAGDLMALDEQDRSVWDRTLIAEGLRILDRSVAGATPGPYLIQACIAGLHAQAPDVDRTDWREILALYRLLELTTNGLNPTIRLNRIVAEAMVHGPARALELLDQLREEHPGLPRLHAVRADLLRRSGDRVAAAGEYREAARAADNLAEQRLLLRRLRELGA
ncbi:RNA polymerase subunit sigma-70 [Nakamurella silvestris]|nr:RNA polymerase subunit sigma-70 [Nakamurella silvestris]